MPFININNCLGTTSSLKIGQCKFFLMACIFCIYSPELSYCPSVCLKEKKKADVHVIQKLWWRFVLSGCSSLWPTSAVGCQIATKIISKKWFPNVQRILLSSRQKKGNIKMPVWNWTTISFIWGSSRSQLNLVFCIPSCLHHSHSLRQCFVLLS